MRIASTLGGLALCAALVLFFYRIWGILPLPGQFLLLLATPLAAVAATEFAARREKTLYYASLLALVAIAAFILNLTALGGILNLAESPHVMLIWGAFALALAYAYELQLALLVALVCLLDYSACLFSMVMGGHWMDHLRHPECFLPGALVALALPCIFPHRDREGFPPLYRGTGLAMLFLALLLLSLNGPLSYLSWQEHTVEVFYQLLGIIGFAALTALAVRRGWMETVYLGSLSFGVLIYVRLFDWWWEWMPKYLFFLIIGLISLSLLALFRKIRSRAPGSRTR